MDHGLSQILRCRCAVPLGNVDPVRRPIVFDDPWMVDRHVVRPLFELVHGVATLAHDLCHELIGSRHRLGGLIDKALLKISPGAQVPVTRLR